MQTNLENSKNRWSGEKFRTEKSFIALAWIYLFIILCLYFMIMAVYSRDYLMILYTSLASVFIYILVIAGMQGQSDIIIGDDGICRSAFGVVWQRTPWGNMEIIKEFGSYKPTAINYRSFNILAIRRPLFNPFGKKLVFNDKIYEWLSFLKILNRYIELRITGSEPVNLEPENWGQSALSEVAPQNARLFVDGCLERLMRRRLFDG